MTDDHTLEHVNIERWEKNIERKLNSFDNEVGGKLLEMKKAYPKEETVVC